MMRYNITKSETFVKIIPTESTIYTLKYPLDIFLCIKILTAKHFVSNISGTIYVDKHTLFITIFPTVNTHGKERDTHTYQF